MRSRDQQLNLGLSIVERLEKVIQAFPALH